MNDVEAAFWLGVRCSEYVDGLGGEKSKALLKTLTEVASGDLTLVDSTAQLFTVIDDLTDEHKTILEAGNKGTREREHAIAKAILGMPSDN